MKGVIKDSTGDLIRAGYSEFIAESGETVREDVPEPAYVLGYGNKTHRWTGSAWVVMNIGTPFDSEPWVKVLRRDEHGEVIQIDYYQAVDEQGAYSGLTRSEEFFYSNNRLLSMHDSRFLQSGEVFKKFRTDYYTDGDGNQVERKSQIV